MAGERVDDGSEQPDRINAASQSSLQAGFRRHHFRGRWIDLPLDLTEAQLDGRACVCCGVEDQRMRPVEAWSEVSSQLFECIDVEDCAKRRRLVTGLAHVADYDDLGEHILVAAEQREWNPFNRPFQPADLGIDASAGSFSDC